MEQAGVGVGMLEISRMERAMRRRPTFVERVFAPDERELCERAARPSVRYASCYAAHVAVLRALGATGLGRVGRNDVTVGRDEAGRPRAMLAGGARELAEEQGVREVAVSLSVTHEVAVANAVALSDAVRPKVVRKGDAAEGLLASFRRARSLLDELEPEGREGAQEDAVAAVAARGSVTDAADSER